MELLNEPIILKFSANYEGKLYNRHKALELEVGGIRFKSPHTLKEANPGSISFYFTPFDEA